MSDRVIKELENIYSDISDAELLKLAEEVSEEFHEIYLKILTFNTHVRYKLIREGSTVNETTLGLTLLCVRDIIDKMKTIRKELETGIRIASLDEILSSLLATKILQRGDNKLNVGDDYILITNVKVIPAIPRDEQSAEYKKLLAWVKEEAPHVVEEKISFTKLAELCEVLLSEGKEPPVKRYVSPTIKIVRKGE
ncbi:MAG: hypothetical protein KatS3mg087_1327 [Patescibacteria group bacterium]|nr:MAG: hypothetical protein KatS3mg087_1327 [Patescibacteria group bacterium]